MKNVRIIPAKLKENKKLRVAAYCRVSTSGPEQMRSLDIQISAYTKMIKCHPNWIFAGVYYDIESGLYTFLEICLYVGIAEHLIGEGQKEAKL